MIFFVLTLSYSQPTVWFMFLSETLFVVISQLFGLFPMFGDGWGDLESLVIMNWPLQASLFLTGLSK
jgi:hypothetical protein